MFPLMFLASRLARNVKKAAIKTGLEVNGLETNQRHSKVSCIYRTGGRATGIYGLK